MAWVVQVELEGTRPVQSPLLRAQRGEGLAGAPARRGPPPASPGPGLYSGLLCPLRPQLGLPPAAVGLGWRPRLPVSPARTHLVGDRGSRGEASAPGGRGPPEATRVSASPAVGALAARSAGEDAGLSSTRAGRPRSAGLPSRRHKRRFLGLFWGSMKQAFRAKCPSHNSVPGPLGQLGPEQGARPRTVFQHRRKALPGVCGRFSPLRSEGSRTHTPWGLVPVWARSHPGHLLPTVSFSFPMTDALGPRHRPQKSKDLAGRVQTRKWPRASATQALAGNRDSCLARGPCPGQAAAASGVRRSWGS